MRAYRRGFFRKIAVKAAAIGLIFIGLFLMLDLKFRSVIETVNAYECKSAVDVIINGAVLETLSESNFDYSSLVELTRNSNGDVVSVQSNITNINRLKTNISLRLEKELRGLSSLEIKIPVGTLLGIQLLHGKGFDVGMTVRPVGYASASIISEFSSAGINQTLHRIIIRINVDVNAIIPGFSTRVSAETSVVAAETVIVGKVPDAYTHVVASDSLSGILNDFGAAAQN